MTIPKIKTVEQLEKILNTGPGYAGYLGLMKAIHIPMDELNDFCSWHEDYYTRNPIFNDSCYQVLLMCWEAGQHTPIHNFNGREGWFKTLEGELHIEEFRLAKASSRMQKQSEFTLLENEISYIHDSDSYHRIVNRSNDRAISLHLYIPAMESWKIFDELKREVYEYKLPELAFTGD